LLQGERANDQEVGLQWKTTHAFYSNAFDVERSLGDSLHFEKVNFVWAKGNISIIDSEGKKVLQYSSFVTDGYNQKDIDIARLPTGVYTIKATLPDKHIRFGKLVKN
jgi:DNA-binding beta-propeller fold protein YncE